MCLPWDWFYVQRRLCLPHLQLTLEQSTELVQGLGFLQGPGYFRSQPVCQLVLVWHRMLLEQRNGQNLEVSNGWRRVGIAVLCASADCEQTQCLRPYLAQQDVSLSRGVGKPKGDFSVFKWTRDKQIIVNGLHLLCLVGAGWWLHLQLYLQAASGSLCWRNKASACSSAMRKRKKSIGQGVAGRQESGGSLKLGKTII